MAIRKIIQERMSSDFKIFNKNYDLLEKQTVVEEYDLIKNYILKHSNENEIAALYLTNEYFYLLTLLACQEIGLCYIPLKSSWPLERVEQIRQLTKFQLLLTDDILSDVLKSRTETSKKDSYKISDESPLYIMFTSGSTGEPKGVVIRRKSYENFLNWINEFFPQVNSSHRMLNSTGYTFDVSLMEVGLFLMSNVQFFCSNLDQNALVLGKEISDLKINIVVTVPNNFNLILSERIFSELDFSSLQFVMLAGSKITPSLLERFKQLLPDVHLYNCYGPTEATIYCIAKKLISTEQDVEKNTVSIGLPIRGCTAIVLNDKNEEANSFENGELLIGGIQLMKEYFNRPELTEKVMFKYKAENYYRTGDLVFRNDKGEYFVTGRLDDTIKVTGQRVNLSDIDGYISNFSYVEEVATIAVDDPMKDSVLISYIVLSDKKVTEKQIKEDMKKKLLSFQIPSKIIIRDELPLNNSGKISKKILKDEYLKK
jgi:D-alanine--poly(phosphoribitol) ligase subunit 1